MAKIELKNITKKYDDIVAILDLNVCFADKEFIVIVGPSGCGKSTILRMIAGLEDVTDGTILFNECRFNDVAPQDRDIAMVFQNYALYPHMNVYDNLAFTSKLKKTKVNCNDYLYVEICKNSHHQLLAGSGGASASFLALFQVYTD